MSIGASVISYWIPPPEAMTGFWIRKRAVAGSRKSHMLGPSFLMYPTLYGSIDGQRPPVFGWEVQPVMLHLGQNSCTMVRELIAVGLQPLFTLLLFITPSAKEQSASVYNVFVFN